MNIGYHTRLFSDNTRKLVGGSYGGSFDMETVNRLVGSGFAVHVKDSGRAVFVDSEQREVCLYVSVDVDTTTKGREALRLWREERERRLELEELKTLEEGGEIECLMSHLDHAEIVRRLTI